MINPKLPAIYYGGDYNPEQWPEEIWHEDMRLFKLAGINIITLPVFAWARLQPAEDVFDFSWLDKVLDLALKNGIYICLATPTAAPPAWMTRKYPDIFPVDINGVKRKFGGRMNFCPNSKDYRKFSARIAAELAQRYKDFPGLLLWHIANEYGTYCYCDTCASEFRSWLKARYRSLENVNKAWNMSFWGHTIYDWEEIVPPSHLNEMWSDSIGERTCFQGISLDYNRFMSDSVLECYKNEYRTIKEITPDIPITTNMMGTFKPLDYFRWAEYMDVISWDNYPSLNDPAGNVALRHDLMRGLKNGKPFLLMEQTPSQTNWQAYNSLKRPGVMRLLSYQAVAHGAESVMFFQMRQSIGACEKLHGAIISHAGHENTRVFKECAQLGKELAALGDKLLDSAIVSKAAIIFDWENWWAIEFSSGPTCELQYVKQIEKYYRAFHDLNIPVDFINPESGFLRYDIVVAPVLYMVRPGVAENLERFVDNGGIFVTTFFSGIVNENDLVTTGGFPGQLRKLLGIWVEEIDALPPDMKNNMIFKAPYGDLSGEYACGMLCDLLHTEGARELAVYGRDFYAGRPCLTVNDFGKGKAYYIASDPEQRFLNDLVKYLCSEKNIRPALAAPDGVEVTVRRKADKSFTFILNHNDNAVEVPLGGQTYLELITGVNVSNTLKLEPKGAAILESGG